MQDKMTFECAVVIPVYRENLSADEEVSLRRCLTVLGEYPIVFAVPRGLNCEKYKRICSEYRLSESHELFDGKFFISVNSYSALMVCGDFYKRFLNYKYILIYQLDAFVFENRLAFWCGRDYDYAGGPAFEVRRGADAPEHTDFLNGGFSLRKTATFHKLAEKKMRLNFFLYSLLSKYDALAKKRGFCNLLKMLFLFGVTRFLYKAFKIEVNEDYAWSSEIKKYGKIAPFDEALRFSFDSCPEYAFKLNGNSLPFGCHGWTAYYNRLFWEEFVRTKSLAMLRKPDE